MSLTSVLNIANSGLQTAQTGLRTVSDNVANVNTAGYVRKVVDQQSIVANGMGSGVGVAQIRTVADQFLEAASRQAGSDAGAASATSDLLDQAQGLFGDPNASSSFFSTLNGAFSGFITLAAAPSVASRAQATAQAQSLFDQASDIAGNVEALRSQAQSRISADVDTANGLLAQIDGLNSEISRATALGQDASGAQDRQSQALDQLSSLLPVSVSARSGGGVVVRTGDGLTLAGAGTPATLSYDASTAEGRFSVTQANGVTSATAAPDSGEIGGLSKLRDTTLPAVKSQLAELVGQTAGALNAVSNQYSAAPPPTALTGRNTGLDLDSDLAHFTGQATVAVTNAAGVPARAAVIDFDAKTISVGGAVTGGFTDGASFLSALNAGLGGQATASFAGGALSITSADTSATSSQRLVVAGGALQADGTLTGPAAAKAGQGFSGFFGLNDLVTSPGIASFATGLQGGDASGYSGGAISFKVAAADGSTLRDIAVTLPSPGGDVNALLASLNSPSSGLGLYGAFSLDQTGSLAFAPNASGVGVQVTGDTTARNGSGPSVSALFGIGDAARGARLNSLSLRSDIQADPSKLALAAWTPSGSPPLSTSDTRGADALAQAANTSATFAAAGGAGAVRASVATYAASFSAALARTSASADSDAATAAAVKTEADGRRSAVEGVNIDQELISLTTYQQAYNASARMIQAAKDMYDVLLNMV